MKKSLLKLLPFLAIALSNCPTYGQGLFYHLPADGSWATYEIKYTYLAKDMSETDSLYISISSVGRVLSDSTANRWIEFFIQSPRDTGKIWIRKLLIPEKYLNHKNNPTDHVIRGWTLSAGETIIEAAVPYHGQWPAYLSGPLNENIMLPKKDIECKKGVYKCKGIKGSIKYTDNLNQITKVTIETWLNKKSPFGVVSTHMFFDVIRGDDSSTYTIDGSLNLIDFGTGAKTRILTHN